MMQKSVTAIGVEKADLNKSVQIIPNQLTSILSSIPFISYAYRWQETARGKLGFACYA